MTATVTASGSSFAAAAQLAWGFQEVSSPDPNNVAVKLCAPADPGKYGPFDAISILNVGQFPITVFGYTASDTISGASLWKVLAGQTVAFSTGGTRWTGNGPWSWLAEYYNGNWYR